MAVSQNEKNPVTIEHIAKLTKSDDTVLITKAEGNITIDTSVNKGSDTLKFGEEYDASKFSTKMSENGRDLELTYTDNSETQTITIKNYFSKDGNSTKSSVKEIEINGEIKNILDLYTNIVSAKGTKINGSMFNDIITGSDKADKIYTGAGNDIITAGKGNDTIIINGAGEKTINIANGDGNDVITGISKADKVTLSGLADDKLSYSKSGNDLIITREEEATTESESAIPAKTTIKDFFKDSKNLEKLDGVTIKDITVTGKGTIIGGFTNDTITGSTKADKIYTGAGNDIIAAGKGNDTIIINGAGNKTINIANGDGNDVITGIAKADKVTLNGLADEKLSYSKSGNDLVITRNESENDDKPLYAKTTIKDFFKDSKNLEKLDGVTIKDITVTGKGTIVGGFTNDTITGSTKADKIYTGAGNDTITAGKGNDTIIINGAGNKTINIANGDGNDVITGVRTEGAKTDLVFDNDVELSYSKNGSNNDLIITRKYKEQLKDKKGNLLYIDSVTGKKVTNNITTINGTEVEGTFYEDKDGNIITEDAYIALGTEAQKGYNIAEGTYYENGNTIITEAEFDKLATDAKDKSGYEQTTGAIYAKTSESGTTYITEAEYNAIGTKAQEGYDVAQGTYYKNGNTIITEDSYNQLVETAKTKLGFGETSGTIYSKTSESGTTYITEAEFNAIGTKAQEGYDVAQGTYYKNGNTIITEDNYNQLVETAKTKLGYTQADGNFYRNTDGTIITESAYNDLEDNSAYSKIENELIYSKTDDNGTSYISQTKYDELVSQAKTDLGYSQADAGDVYTNGSSYISKAEYDQKATDAKKNSGYEAAHGKFYQKGDEIITEAEYNKRVENAKNELGYTQADAGDVYTDGSSYISKAEYDKLATDAQDKSGYKTAEGIFYQKDGEIITKAEFNAIGTKAQEGYTQAKADDVYTDGTSYISKAEYDKLAEDAKAGYERADKVYSYGTGEDLKYSTDATKDITNSAATEDRYNKTTIKDFFENGVGSSDVTINGKEIDFKDGVTILSAKTLNGTTYNDTYTVNSLSKAVEIVDNGGNDILNLNVKNTTADDLRYIFDVDNNGTASGDLLITDKTGIKKSNFQGVAINDYFTTGKVETINLNGNKVGVDEVIANISNDVKNFLQSNGYENASDVFDGKDKQAKADLKEIYNSGNNKYNFSTVEGNAEQTVTDKIGDNDIYSVDGNFDFANDKLVISDLQGDNDVLDLTQKADDLTILFDIKKEGESSSAVGDALYVIGKGQTNLNHGIQMSGIDKVKASDGDVSAPTDEIVSAVQSWLANANDGKGYDSVADAIQNNDANLANLIAKFAPSQPQG